MEVSFVASTILILIVGALAISSISYSRQQALMRRQKNFTTNMKAARDLRVFRDTLLKLDPEYDLLTTIQNQIILKISRALELQPKNQKAITTLSQEKSAMAEYQQHQRPNPISHVITSVEEHRQAKQSLNALARLLETIRARGQISIERKHRLQEHIKFIELQVDVKSHEKRSEIFGQQNEFLMQYQELKAARDALTKSPIQFDDKNTHIRELSDRLNTLQKGDREKDQQAASNSEEQ